MQRRALFGLAAMVLRARDASAATADIHIDNFVFTPDRLKVAVGTTVKFTNRDDLPHSVVSAERPPLFKSKTLDTDDSFTFTFDKSGEYIYFCGLHPHMKGVVVVA
jgi:plastocyanin